MDQDGTWHVEVGLGSGHIVLDRDPAPPEKNTAPHPIFGPCLLWPRSPISTTAELLSVIPHSEDMVTSCAAVRQLQVNVQ